jgi:hypothetical protein
MPARKTFEERLAEGAANAHNPAWAAQRREAMAKAAAAKRARQGMRSSY